MLHICCLGLDVSSGHAVNIWTQFVSLSLHDFSRTRSDSSRTETSKNMLSVSSFSVNVLRSSAGLTPQSLNYSVLFFFLTNPAAIFFFFSFFHLTRDHINISQQNWAQCGVNSLVWKRTSYIFHYSNKHKAWSYYSKPPPVWNNSVTFTHIIPFCHLVSSRLSQF